MAEAAAPALDRRRIDRALAERIYLRGTHATGADVMYDVTGQSGNDYKITINQTTKTARCTCPDHAVRNSTCKHILYVLFRILRADNSQTTLQDVIQSVDTTPQINQPRVCQSAVLTRIWDKYKTNGKAWKEPRWEDKDECPICFDELKPESEYIHWCRLQCGKCLHRSCYDAVAMKTLCPCCRSKWT